jgi:hypothetical protein
MIKNAASLVSAILLIAGLSRAADALATAEVSGVSGGVTATVGGSEAPLVTGMRLAAGATIRAAPGSAADIYLGPAAGVIRLTQKAVLTIERLESTNNAVDVYLHLRQGAILGNGSKVSAGAKFQIKNASGIADISNAAFRLHAEGYLVVIEGKVRFAHVPPDSPGKLHSLHAPPAVYFSPTEGIKEAPKELVREIVNQSKAQLGAK